MKFKNFRIHAEPYIMDAKCNCGQKLKEVSNGFLSSVMYCPFCEEIYELKLIKIPKKKISKEFLEHCRKESKKGIK